MSYMNRLPTAWVTLGPDVQLIKRGNAYHAKPVPAKPSKPAKSSPKAPKSRKKST